MRNIKTIVSLILLTGLINNSTFSQTIITGSLKQLPNSPIQILSQLDEISQREHVISKSQTDSLGSFSLSIELNQPQLLHIVINDVHAWFYAEKNSKLNVDFIISNSDFYKYDLIEKFYLPEVSCQETLCLNNRVNDFNNLSADFLERNYKSVITKKALPRFFPFRDSVLYSLDSNQVQNYYSAFVFYKLAEMELTCFQSRKNLYDYYLKDMPILYNHSGYMGFFNEFYSSFFKSVSPSQKKLLEQAIFENNVAKIKDVMKIQYACKNDTLCELVLIKSLFENFRNPDYSREGILGVLGWIKSNSAYKEHRLIARNALMHLTELNPGFNAPEFEKYIDLKFRNFKSENLSNRYKYLMFWKTDCGSCLKEMGLLNNFKNEFGDDVGFIAINIDNDSTKFSILSKKNIEISNVACWSSSKELLSNYRIKSVPQYFLIDRNGKLVLSPAPAPSAGLKDILIKIKSSEPQNEYKLWQQR